MSDFQPPGLPQKPVELSAAAVAFKPAEGEVKKDEWSNGWSGGDWGGNWGSYGDWGATLKHH